MELKFFSPIKFSNLNWRINPSLEGCWDAEAPERILSGRVFAVEGRKGEGRGPSKCGWWRQRKQNIFYWSAKLPFLSLFPPLAGLGLEPWCGPVEGYHSREGRAGVSTNNRKKCPLETVDKPDWFNWHHSSTRHRPPMFMFILSIWQS